MFSCNLTILPSCVALPPDCAVCADDYAWGEGYTCIECRNATAHTTQVLGIVVLVILAGVLARVLQYLVSLPRPTSGRNMSRWQRYITRAYQAIPIQAIKIIIVAWQIITEVGATVASVY